MRKRDEVREQIYEIVSDDKLTYTQIVERIINLSSIAVVDREVELPNPEPSSLDLQYEGETLLYGRVCGEMGYRRAQQDMVKKGWVEEVNK